MSSDMQILAVNELIAAYESALVKSIKKESDTSLEITQVSNLHKIEMFLHGYEIGNNLEAMASVKETMDISAEVDSNAFISKKKSFYEECETLVKPRKVKDVLSSFEVSTKDSGVKVDSKYFYNSYKYNINKEHKSFLEELNEINEAADLENCFNCKLDIDAELLIPAYELNWELKQFLANLKSLLKEIKASLDPTALIDDFCSFYTLLKQNWLCGSSYPLLAASIPVLINKNRTELNQIGISWTGGLGAIIAPILTAGTNLLEFLRTLIIPIFDCIINATRTVKIALESINNAIDNLYDQVSTVGDTFKYTEDTILQSSKYLNDAATQMLISEAAKQKAQEARQPPISTRSTTTASESSKRVGTLVGQTQSSSKEENNLFGRIHQSTARQPYFKSGKWGEQISFSREVNVDTAASLNLKSSSARKPNKKLDSLRSVINIVNLIEQTITTARNYVNNFIGTLVYALKSFSRLIVEPLFISTRLITELKVYFNLIRLFRLIIKLINEDNLCNNFSDSNSNKLLKSELEKEFKDISLEFEANNSDGTELAYLKARNSNYSRRLEPNDCGDILVNVNQNQMNLDLLYDSIIKDLR